MFDIGFSEIAVIAVVALVVLGPEKLPKTARTLGHLFGRLQRYVNEVKADIRREIDLEELRKLQQNVQSAAKDIETSLASATASMEKGVRSVESDLNATAGGTAASASPASAGTEAAAPGSGAPAIAAIAPGGPPPAAVAPAPAPPGGTAAAAHGPEEPPRQATLPGFDRG